jgi:hypothetical protein
MAVFLPRPIFDRQDVARRPPGAPLRWLRAALERAGAAKAKAETEAAKARAASLEAARKLTETVSLRDAGELLGLSQEGVRKILKAG